MSRPPEPPDFFDLVGDDGTPEELEQLRHAHDLLIAAGPPAELPPNLREAPTKLGKRSAPSSSSSWLPRRRRGTAFVLAAGVIAAAFAVGYFVGNRGNSQFAAIGRPIAMHATTPAGQGRASILIGDRDSVGNWPLLVKVSGLKPLPRGEWYELYLTKKGKWVGYCGAFSVRPAGRTTVRLSVPYSFRGIDGWIVTTSKRAPQHQVLLTT